MNDGSTSGNAESASSTERPGIAIRASRKAMGRPMAMEAAVTSPPISRLLVTAER